MEGLAPAGHPDLLVGTATGDDAAVYRLAPDLALAQTLDYITPMVDDPYLFGQVAAANALSDVYAMGGKPLLAMNICSFPRRGAAADYRRILEGGRDKVAEAGALVVGGQTVEGAELVYGLSVTGTVHPDRVWTNAGARPGDALILTKPIGTGVVINAVKLGKGGTPARAALARACEAMRVLNRVAAETAARFEVHAATDVTGFGLAGHAWNVARESRARLRFTWCAVPRFAESLDLIRAGVATGLTEPNRRNLEGRIRFDAAVPPEGRALFFDPQTSGGLLLAVAGGDAAACLAALLAAGVPAARVGDVLDGPAGIEVTP